MSKKIFLILIGFFLLFVAQNVFAEVLINEVQVYPKENSFVELYNSGNSSIDLTGWSLKRKTSSGTEYPFISSARLEGKTIGANSYFLIGNEGLYSGSASLDATWASSYSLANNNSLLLLNSDQTVEEVGWGDCSSSCVAENPAEGLSIQRTSSGWVIGGPTPKAENISNGSVVEVSSSTSNTSISTPQKVLIPEVNKTKLIVATPAYAGLPVSFSVQNSVSKDSCGMYVLNFGDGQTLETEKVRPIPQKFSHIYDYAGEYVAYLECYMSYMSLEPDSFDKVSVKVVAPEVSISRVGDEKDFFVELSNNNTSEIDISGWSLMSALHKFTFPKNSILKPKSKTSFSPKITGLSILDKSSLQLFDSEGELVYTSARPASTAKASTKSSTVSSAQTTGGAENLSWDNVRDTAPDLRELLAEAVASDQSGQGNSFYTIGFIALILLTALGVYFFRKKGRVLTPAMPGEDFEIIDE